MKQTIKRVLLVLCGVFFALSGASFVRAGISRRDALEAGADPASGPSPAMFYALGGMLIVLSVTLPLVLSRARSRWD